MNIKNHCVKINENTTENIYIYKKFSYIFKKLKLTIFDFNLLEELMNKFKVEKLIFENFDLNHQKILDKIKKY